jgi:hypothetical protein
VLRLLDVASSWPTIFLAFHSMGIENGTQGSGMWLFSWCPFAVMFTSTSLTLLCCFAVCVYPSREQAKENAALSAILFLKGALTPQHRARVLIRTARFSTFQLAQVGRMLEKPNAEDILKDLETKLHSIRVRSCLQIACEPCRIKINSARVCRLAIVAILWTYSGFHFHRGAWTVAPLLSIQGVCLQHFICGGVLCFCESGA